MLSMVGPDVRKRRLRYPMYLCRGSTLSRNNDRRVVPSAGLAPAVTPAAKLRGPLARLTGDASPATSLVSLTRLTGNALAEPPFAEARVPQVCGTDSAPTLAARASPADTAPPSGAVPTEPRVVATLPSPALTSVNAATVESAAVAAEFDPVERAESADKIMEGTVAKALIPELTVSGSSALFMSPRICWMIVSNRRRGLCPTGIGDRGALGRQTGRVGVLPRRGEWGQRCSGGRGAGIPVHGGRVLGPHLGILSLSRHDGRRIDAQEIGGNQRRQLCPVSNDQRRWHGGSERGLECRRRRLGLDRRVLGLSGGGVHPRDISRGGSGHRCRRRAPPAAVGQPGDHGRVRRRRRVQFLGYVFPGRRAFQHRPRAGTGIHSAAVDFWWQCSEIHLYVPIVSVWRSRWRPRWPHTSRRRLPRWQRIVDVSPPLAR